MSKKPPRPGEGPSRFKGEGQHGWSPDVDEEPQQPNPGAHRSFHRPTTRVRPPPPAGPAPHARPLPLPTLPRRWS